MMIGFFVLAIVIMLVVSFASFSVGWNKGAEAARTVWRNDAIEHNAAEWRIDPRTGDTYCVWLTKKEPPHDA